MVSFEEYTSRERIVLRNEIVTVDKILVDAVGTVYANLTKEKEVDIAGLLKTYDRITKLAKAKGVKISYKNKTKTKLQELQKGGKYKNTYKEYEEKFNRLGSLWKEKLKIGLYMGTSDDEMLNKEIIPLKWEIEAMFRRSETLSVAATLEYELNNLEKDLKNEDGYVSITL